MATRTTIFATNDTLTADDLNSLAGAWTAYTPTLSQGASTDISKTVSYAKYVQFGKLVMCNVFLSAAGSGTAASPITVTLPVTAALTNVVVGNGLILDNGVARYQGAALLSSTTTVAVWAHGLAWGIGQTPSFAVASGDVVHLSLVYEAA